MSTNVDVNSLSLGIVRKCGLAQLTSNTGLLVTTERKSGVKHVVAVNPDGSSLKLLHKLHGGVDVLGVDGGSETVLSVVSDLGDLVESRELSDGSDRAENLLLHDLHVRLDVGDDGRLNEVTLVTLTLTTALDLAALLLAGPGGLLENGV